MSRKERTMGHSIEVLVDWENISQHLTDDAEGKGNAKRLAKSFKAVRYSGGNVRISAFANFNSPYFNKHVDWLLQQRVNLVPVEVFRTGKNTADIVMSLYALRSALTNNDVDEYVLFTGDSDMMPIVNELKLLNKKVSIYAFRGSLSKSLRENCDYYHYLSPRYPHFPSDKTDAQPESWQGKVKRMKMDIQPISMGDDDKAVIEKTHEIMGWLSNDRIAIKELKRGYNTSTLKLILTGVIRGFDHRKAGYKKFSNFLEAALQHIDYELDGDIIRPAAVAKSTPQTTAKPDNAQIAKHPLPTAA
jgi:hypothetical protein